MKRVTVVLLTGKERLVDTFNVEDTAALGFVTALATPKRDDEYATLTLLQHHTGVAAFCTHMISHVFVENTYENTVSQRAPEVSSLRAS